DSVVHRRGHEFLLIFPRQSGKNEAVAHLLTYLLVTLHRRGGNIVFGAVGDGCGRMKQRMEQRLDNYWCRGRWRKAANPDRLLFQQAALVFLSAHPAAASRGETAHSLLVLDEF